MCAVLHDSLSCFYLRFEANKQTVVVALLCGCSQLIAKYKFRVTSSSLVRITDENDRSFLFHASLRGLLKLFLINIAFLNNCVLLPQVLGKKKASIKQANIFTVLLLFETLCGFRCLEISITISLMDCSLADKYVILIIFALYLGFFSLCLFSLCMYEDNAL